MREDERDERVDFRAARQDRRSRRGAGVERDVTFTDVGVEGRDAIDQAYREKYAPRYASTYVDPMFTADAAAATLRLVPAG
jgi:hypothetical protein